MLTEQQNSLIFDWMNIHGQFGFFFAFFIQGENPFTGNHDDQDPEDSMLMDVSEMELTNETLDGQTDSAQTQEEPASQEDVGEEAEAEAETDAAAEEVKMEEEQHIAGEEEGFEVGEEEEEEGGYVIHDEVGEEELGEAEDEGLETGDVEDEELNQEWLKHPGCIFVSLTSVWTSTWPHAPTTAHQLPGRSSPSKFCSLYVVFVADKYHANFFWIFFPHV